MIVGDDELDAVEAAFAQANEGKSFHDERLSRLAI
jgi:hypothetical protein